MSGNFKNFIEKIAPTTETLESTIRAAVFEIGTQNSECDSMSSHIIKRIREFHKRQRLKKCKSKK